MCVRTGCHCCPFHVLISESKTRRKSYSFYDSIIQGFNLDSFLMWSFHLEDVWRLPMVTSVGRMGVMLDFFCVWFIFVWFPIWDLIIQTQCREKRTLRSSGFSNNTKLNVSINCNVIVEFGTFYFEMREIPITSFSQKLNIWFFFFWNMEQCALL